MRKPAWTFCFLLLLQYASAQFIFDGGITTSWGPTMMLNANMKKDPAYTSNMSFGRAIGFKLGLHYLGTHGITFEYLNAHSRQDFAFDLMDLKGNPNNYDWKHRDILTMYRYSARTFYIEGGPKFSSISEFEQEFLTNEGDAAEFFKTNYTSVVIGIGTYLIGTDALTLRIGARLHWGGGDIISQDGVVANYPGIITAYDNYEPTTVAAVQLHIELNYSFGRKSCEKCRDKWNLIPIKGK